MKITCPNLDLAQRPVAQCALMPAPLSPKDGLVALADKVEKDSAKKKYPTASSTVTDCEYD